MLELGAETEPLSVLSLRRYPVKSMLGEELDRAEVGERGLVGDRVYALVDTETGKVVSAKNPRKWSRLFEFGATFVEAPSRAGAPPAVLVAFPDGRVLASAGGELDAALSAALGRTVALASSAPDDPVLEEYWPDIEGLALREATTDEAMPPGTFFDLGMVHVLTTATLGRLAELYPEGRFEARRFRPNVLVEAEGSGFVENDWVGRRLGVGGEVELEVTGACPRCVMTTLPQGDLPKDPGILRAAAAHNGANVGVYAKVVRGGAVKKGDTVRVL